MFFFFIILIHGLYIYSGFPLILDKVDESRYFLLEKIPSRDGYSNQISRLSFQRQQLKKQLEKVKNQKEKLESLCRSLQAERKQISTATSNSDSTLVLKFVKLVYFFTQNNYGD